MGRLAETLQQMLDDPEEVAPSRCSTFLHYTWKIFTCIFSHVILVSLVVSYCIMGAFTFQSLEKNNEIKVRLGCLVSSCFIVLWLLASKRPEPAETEHSPPSTIDIETACSSCCFL